MNEGNELLNMVEHCYTHVDHIKQKINNMRQIVSQQNKAQNSEQEAKTVQICKRKSILIQLAQSYKEQIFEIRPTTQTQQAFTNELNEERESADAAVAASDDDDDIADTVETAPTVDAIEATPVIELTAKRSAKKSNLKIKSLFGLNFLLYNL
jgi:hypothetical protein